MPDSDLVYRVVVQGTDGHDFAKILDKSIIHDRCSEEPETFRRETLSSLIDTIMNIEDTGNEITRIVHNPDAILCQGRYRGR